MLQDEEPEISVAPQSPPKATSINKSDLITRQKSLPSDIFKVNDDMKLLHNLIQQFVWQKRIKPDTLGDLEDLVATAMENVNNMLPDLTRDKDDTKFLTEHKIQRSVRVNVSHAHKINKYRELYESAMKTYNMEELREKNILYWRTEKMFEHANKCLNEVKEKHTRARSSSSSGTIIFFSNTGTIFLGYVRRSVCHKSRLCVSHGP